MTIQRVRAKVIQAGYDWTFRIIFPNASYGVGATFTAQVRQSPDSAVLLASMTTAAGTITRIDGQTLDFLLTGVQTANWPARTVYIDVIRTDTTPDQHLNFLLGVPVKIPVTRL